MTLQKLINSADRYKIVDYILENELMMLPFEERLLISFKQIQEARAAYEKIIDQFLENLDCNFEIDFNKSEDREEIISTILIQSFL